MLSERFRFPFVLGVGVALLSLAATSRAQTGPAGGMTAATTPVGLADMQTGQVAVTYLNGELTIKARNAPLIDVLNAVGRQTGAKLDISAADGLEQIVANLGPGPAQVVLASLLKSRGLNYAIVGSADPKALVQVFILPRIHEPDAPSPVTPTLAAPIPVTQRISSPPVASIDGRKQKKISEDQKQIKELFAQARAELTDLPAAADSDAAANFINQVEAQMMAAVQDGSLEGPAASVAASDTLSNTPPSADLPRGRPRHR